MKILIPMSGVGKRFKDSGYSKPKYLLDVFGKPVLQHIFELFSDDDDIHLILNKQDFNNEEIIKTIKNIILNKNISFHSIENHKKGPGFALLSSGLLETDQEVFINYCDFANIWNWGAVKEYIEQNKPDGLLPAYKGVHIHSIYGSNYAFIETKNKSVTGIKEKEPFTNNPIEEYASTGGYYFATGKIAKKYINELFVKDILINGEAYISSAYDLMIKDGLNVNVFDIDYFFQWGTPEDYEEFLYCMDEIDSLKTDKQINLSNFNLVIPAAGMGSRFSDKGYTTPKIFLNVNGNKMIKTILNKFKNQSTTSVLGNKYVIDKLNEVFADSSNVRLSSVDSVTKGQSDSANLLIKEIENDLPIFIQSADCILSDIDLNKIMSLDPDLVVLTKQNYRRAIKNPESYGWVLSENNLINKTNIKKKPNDKNYSMILGSFIFKNKELYQKIYKELLKQAPGELHIDYMIDIALSMDLKVVELTSNSASVIGTPLEFELHKYSEFIFNWLQNEN